MRVTVHVRQDIAHALREEAGNAAAEQLRDTARELGARLVPAFPGTPDPTLASTYILDLPESIDPTGATARLRSLPAVEAVYVKPGDEPPAI